MQISDPNVYSEHEKPPQFNLIPSRSSGSRQFHADVHQLPASTPFPYYQAPYMYFPQHPWPTNPNPNPVTLTSQPVSPHQNPSGWSKSVKGPAIFTWLQYCDSHPNHGGDNLAALTTNFKAQGYQTIDQLTSGCISIENLLSWINIGKGTADYIVQYADEDMVLVNDGKFTMVDLPNVNGSGDVFF